MHSTSPNVSLLESNKDIIFFLLGFSSKMVFDLPQHLINLLKTCVYYSFVFPR